MALTMAEPSWGGEGMRSGRWGVQVREPRTGLRDAGSYTADCSSLTATDSAGHGTLRL